MLRPFLIALGALCLPLAVHASDWKVDSAKSTLGFSGSYDQDPFQGTFKTFAATISYDPADLAKAKFDVSVDLASADTQSSERDETLAGPDFFDSGKFPKAHFVTTSFTQAGDKVQAHGTLTIRDKSQPVTLDVTFRAGGSTATLDVATTLKRADFGLGIGKDWVDVGADVAVRGHLLLTGN